MEGAFRMAQIPEKIGKYVIKSVIAVGGMGTVYKAVHPSLDREVILKRLTISRAQSSIKERFKREAQILVDLNNPYIVRMYDYFTEGRSDYIVLEYVDGMSLDRLIKKEVVLPPPMAMLILLDACLGLKSAHSKGIVHRDIKPGNILISKKAQVKLADFGIASGEKGRDDIEQPGLLKKVDRQTIDGITQVGVTLGTPSYMSPEQFEDSRSVDIRADIYSLGVMLYEMVTGQKPFQGDLSQEYIDTIKKGKYIAPKRIDKSLPRDVCYLIKKMMKPKPSARFHSVDPIISRIRKYLVNYDSHAIRVTIAQAIVSKDNTPINVVEPKERKGKRIFSIFVAAVVLLSGVYFAWQEGVIHRYIFRKWYTPVDLTIELPSTASIDADLPPKVFFFVNDNNEIPEVAGSRRVFYADRKNSIGNDSVNYKIKTVFLRKGDYRIKVVEGPYIWWDNINVNEDNINLNLGFLINAKRSLVVHTSCRDFVSNEDISNITKFKVEIKDKWLDLDVVDPALLKTGASYRFYATADGYREEYFGVRVDWYQDELFINTTLKRKN